MDVLNNNLNLETKKFLNKVIELNNMNYDRLLNDEYFDEFKEVPKSNIKIKSKLQDNKDKMLGNQKHLVDNNVYASRRKIKIETESELNNIKSDVNNIVSEKRTIISEKRTITSEKRPIKTDENNIRKIKKDLVGGFDKTIKPPYKSEKNTPFLTNDERSTFKKRSAENPPREPPILMEQTIYDTSKSKPPAPQVPPAYIPVYDEVGSAVATIPSFNNLTVPNPAYNQPFQKIYNIVLFYQDNNQYILY